MVAYDDVVSVKKLSTEDVKDVYDISVPNNDMFFANSVLVHNTDSIFLYIDPVLRAVLGEDYDSTTDEEKIDLTLKIVKKCADYVNEYVIKELLRYHNTPSDDSIASKYDFNFKEELVIKRALFGDVKKKYAIWQVLKEGKNIDKLAVTGFEVVRSDYPRFSREIMQDLLEAIIKKGELRTQLINRIDDYVTRYKKLLNSGSTDAGIPCVWNNRNYKVVPRHVKGMWVYNACYGPVFQPGDKGYRFELNMINTSRLSDDAKEKLQEFQTNHNKGKLVKFITIPAYKTLDTRYFEPNTNKMLDYAVYDRVDHLVDIFGINVKNTDIVTWDI